LNNKDNNINNDYDKKYHNCITAGVENAGVDRMGGKCGSGNGGSRLHGCKM